MKIMRWMKNQKLEANPDDLSGERILELSKVKLTALASGFNRSLR
jgi:hypothetical protein